jgi:4-amino-4-deoxy-L-arabinose transferase-like glycosyltransferase
MDKITIDILITIAFVAALFLGGRAYFAGKYRVTLYFILGISLLLRGYQLNKEKINKWDECYHALVAKNLAKHPATPTLFDTPALVTDEDEWTASHLWLSKPPIPLWTMSTSISIFGTNTFAIRFPSLLVGILSVLLTFLLARRFFDEKVALIAAFLHAINGLLIEVGAGQVSSDHVETFFIFFVQAGIYFSILSIQKDKAIRYLILAGVFTGFAFLSKWFPAVLVWPVWLAAFIFSGKFEWKKLFLHALMLGGVSFLVALPWILRVNSFGDDILMRVLFAFVEPVQLHENPPYYYWHQIMIIFGEAVYVAVVLPIVMAYKKTDLNKLAFLLVWLFIPMIIFTFGETKRHTYLLVAAPAIFILIAYTIQYLSTLKTANLKWLSRIAIAALMILPVRYMFERTKLFQNEVQLSKFYAISQDRLDQFDANDVVVNLDENIELMFLSEVGSAYKYLPSHLDIIELTSQGKSVWYYDDGEFGLLDD